MITKKIKKKTNQKKNIPPKYIIVHVEHQTKTIIINQIAQIQVVQSQKILIIEYIYQIEIVKKK